MVSETLNGEEDLSGDAPIQVRVERVLRVNVMKEFEKQSTTIIDEFLEGLMEDLDNFDERSKIRKQRITRKKMRNSNKSEEEDDEDEKEEEVPKPKKKKLEEQPTPVRNNSFMTYIGKEKENYCGR